MSKKADVRFSDTRRIKGSGNVFLDLGFDPAEARIMALRAEVMSGESRLANDAWIVCVLAALPALVPAGVRNPKPGADLPLGREHKNEMFERPRRTSGPVLVHFRYPPVLMSSPAPPYRRARRFDRCLPASAGWWAQALS